MNREQYTAQREEFINRAQAAIDSGDIEAARQANAEISALDESFEAEGAALANLNALREAPVINVGRAGVVDNGLVPAGNRLASGPVIGGGPTDEEKAEYSRVFAHAMMKHTLDSEQQRVFALFNPDITNAAQTSADQQVVIPDTLVQDIWREAAKVHPVLGVVSMTNIKGKVTYPKEDGTGSSAAWYDETDSVADGTVATASIELDGWELAKCVPCSWKLQKMSIDAFLVYLRDNLAAKMGDALASAIFSGSGVAGEGDGWKSQPLGVITALEAEADTPQIVTWTASTDEVSYAKLTAVMSKLKSGYAGGAAIFAKNDFIWNILANVKDSNGRPYFVANPINGGVGMLFGKTVYEEDAAPADGMLLANFARGYKMNSQENITMYTEDHKKARITDYMAYALIDGKPISTAPFVYLKKSV